ncbi:hypothetical protein OS493_000042 [Desmophyllum pertusum]|uniref:Uncharacterized protein n=1 Tax=Desmophyllum pertusum TaxID=174260 RepID=A0A9X0A6R1_9CNID|nr:hypothetical protein OS493_000042 [Desmophyllum pertusum]
MIASCLHATGTILSWMKTYRPWYVTTSFPGNLSSSRQKHQKLLAGRRETLGMRLGVGWVHHCAITVKVPNWAKNASFPLLIISSALDRGTSILPSVGSMVKVLFLMASIRFSGE